MRILRWLLLLLCLAGVAYIAVAVPLGGQTLWARLTGGAHEPAVAAPGAAEAGDAATGDAAATAVAPGDAASGDAAIQARDGGLPPTDLTTESDRKALDHLIEDKLAAPPGRAPGAP